MDSKAWTAALVALLIGAAAGYLIANATMTEQGRGRGEIPPPPSEEAGGIPPGTWSKVPCGGGQATDILDDIYGYAVTDYQTGSLPQAQFDQVYALLVDCAVGGGVFGGGANGAYCTLIQGCLGEAQQGLWGDVIDALSTGQ